MPGAISLPPADGGTDPADPFLPVHWYPKFTAHADAARLVTLSPEFVTLLSSGSIYLPDLPNASATTDIEWSDGTVEPRPDPTDPTTASAPARATDEAAIEAAIAELGGAVCPKLNAACPVDATWANIHRSTKCTSVDDVLTLIQSSERVLRTLPSSDLPRSDSAQQRHISATLFLRRWASDFDARNSFRLFVRGRDPVAVALRAPSGVAVEFSEDRADAVVAKLCDWHDAVVRDAFTDAVDYAVDARLDARDAVVLVDFAPWRSDTDALLFEWDELDSAPWLSATGRPQFRAALRESIAPSEHASAQLPVELRGRDVVSELAGAAQRFVQAQEQAEQGRQNDCSSDDEGDAER